MKQQSHPILRKVSLPSGYSETLPQSSPGAVPPLGPSGELEEHRVSVRPQMRLLVHHCFSFFFFSPWWGQVVECMHKILITMDGAAVESSSLLDEGEQSKVAGNSEIELLYFN